MAVCAGVWPFRGSRFNTLFKGDGGLDTTRHAHRLGGRDDVLESNCDALRYGIASKLSDWRKPNSVYHPRSASPGSIWGYGG
jgi:hypothetical protein